MLTESLSPVKLVKPICEVHLHVTEVAAKMEAKETGDYKIKTDFFLLGGILEAITLLQS